MKGFTDKPTEQINNDDFGIQQYVDGLSNFVLECNTPMTVAIQGDWGSGKTSMMNMIKEKLGEKAVTVWFNTWQFSQFNLGDELALSLISSLIDSFDVNHESAQSIKKSISTIKKVTKSVSSLVVDTLVGGKAADLVGKGFDMLEGHPETTDVTKILTDLKKKYEECVNALLTEKDKNLLVVFVDDLDRLPPQKAVELLEVLKLFLDCENCVYILAIDYAVVSQGVMHKYGSIDFDSDKGKSFFDKIIQVPFKMPVAHYQVGKFVGNLLTQLGIECDPECKDDKEIQTYIKLINASTGCNPRSMKRLFNVYLLLSKVDPTNSLNDNWSKKVLFAILCLQLSYENLYTYIVNNRNILDGGFLKSLTKPETYKDKQEDKSLLEELSIKSDLELSKIMRFMGVLNEVIDKDENDELDDEEANNFVRILGFSTITSSNTSSEEIDDSERLHFRQFNRACIKLVNEALSAKFRKIKFNSHQPRTDTDDLKNYYAQGWTQIPCLNSTINLEYNIMTNLESKKSLLQLSISPNKKSISVSVFKEFIQRWPEYDETEFEWDEKNARFIKICEERPKEDENKMKEYVLSNTEKIISSLMSHC